MASELTANGNFHHQERAAPAVTYTVTPPAAPRQRLTTLVRPVLALPHILIVGGPGIGAGAGWERTGVFAFIGAVINWFAYQRADTRHPLNRDLSSVKPALPATRPVKSKPASEGPARARGPRL
jgi:hypothetical protein